MVTKIEEVVQSTQYIGGDTLAKTLAFNGQCFLVQNMFEISRQAAKVPLVYNRGTKADPKTRGYPALPHHTEIYRDLEQAGTPKDPKEPQISGYRHVAPVLSTGHGRAATSYSSLIRRKNGDKIVEISTDLMALLVPTLRIYKVEYESMVDPEDSTKLVPDLGKEPIEREVIFDDFVDPADLDAIFFNRKGRIGGTGIKSFQWDLKGVNPADVDANITAQLNIFFNNVQDIFTDETGKRQLKAGRAGKASFLDLIIYAPQRKAADMAGINPDDPLYMLYDGVFFEIKAVVGWGIPPNASSMFPRPDGTTLEDFREAIRHSQTILFLQLTTHRFDFNQDGTANLIINYRGRYDNKRNSHDIFNVNKKERKTYNELVKEKTQYPERFRPKVEGDPDTAAAVRLKKATFKFQAKLEVRYNKIINMLLGRLYTAQATPLQLGAVKRKTGSPTSDPHGGGSGGFLGTRGATTDELFKLVTEVKGRAETTDTRRNAKNLGISQHSEIPQLFLEDASSAAERQKFIAEFFPNQGKKVIVRQFGGQHIEKQLFGTDTPQEYIKDATGEYVDEAGTVPTEKTQTTALEASLLTAYMKAERAPLAGTLMGPIAAAATGGTPLPEPATKEKVIEVPFFFLGDLIDVAVETLLANQENDDDRAEAKRTIQKFITTDIEFFNLKAFYQIGESMTQKVISKHNIGGADHRLAGFTPGTYFKMLKLGRMSLNKDQRKRVYKPINIASIPIQFDYFVEWYAQNVAAQRRQFYFLNNFIVDVLTQIVRPSLSAQCFYGVPAQQTHLSMIDFMVNKASPLEFFLFPPAIPTTRVASVSQLESRNLIPAPALLTPSRGPREGPGLFSNFKVVTLTTVHPDLLEGNYKEDREAGIYHFIVGADRGLLKEATFNRMDAPYLREARIDRNRIAGAEQLRELYNVSLNLYGAPILKPGQLIYVTPSPLGFGDPRSKNSVSRYLGIGGYHMIISVQSVIDSQGYQTRVKALHQAMPARDEVDIAVVATPPAGAS